MNSTEEMDTSIEHETSVKLEKMDETNEENVHVKNKTDKYSCELCGKKFQFSSNYKKHKNQFLDKHTYYNCCNTVEPAVENGHTCKRIPLKSNAMKKNQQMNSKKPKIKIQVLDDGDDDADEDGVDDDEDDNEVLNSDNDESKAGKNKQLKRKSSPNEEHKIYKCQECLELFLKYTSLCQHLKLVHKKQGKFKCQICDEDFNTNEEFQTHSEMHGPEDTVVCKGCRKTFNSLKSYYIHAKQNPGVHCFVCRLCLRKFPTELMLDQHVCICQNGKPLHCACGREFTRYEDVIDHSKGTKPFSCCSCPHLANSLTAYIRHLRKHSKQKPYQCTKCDMKFAVIDFLNIHNKKCHSENELPKDQNPDADQVEEHVCCSCVKKFNSEEELKEHNYWVHMLGDDRVQCPDCGKLLKRNRLENHRNTHKTSASLCSECGKLFDTRFKLTQHIITAHNNEPVKCEICMKVLKTKKILNEHMKTHLKSELGGRIPQAICPMCGLGLAQKGSLARHILLTHEKHKIIPSNKTYTCQECSAVLPNRAKYYSHRRMHRAMVDRFPCEVCSREFNKKQNLKRHMYLLHDVTRVLAERIFKCQFCVRSFREKKNLKRHYKMVHKVEDII